MILLTFNVLVTLTCPADGKSGFEGPFMGLSLFGGGPEGAGGRGGKPP